MLCFLLGGPLPPDNPSHNNLAYGLKSVLNLIKIYWLVFKECLPLILNALELSSTSDFRCALLFSNMQSVLTNLKKGRRFYVWLNVHMFYLEPSLCSLIFLSTILKSFVWKGIRLLRWSHCHQARIWWEISWVLRKSSNVTK